MNSGHCCGLMMLGMYLLSALGMWLLVKRRNKKENKSLDNDDKGLIFIPVINTIGLFAELWDVILG
jgi:LPXTG-motif cell wall-anchored protein